MSSPAGAAFAAAAVSSAWSLAVSAPWYSAMLRFQRRHPLLQPPLGQDAGFARIAVKERTVERHQLAASRSRMRASSTNSRLAACSPAALSLRKLAIVR
jgi:hypothetical protein